MNFAFEIKPSQSLRQPSSSPLSPSPPDLLRWSPSTHRARPLASSAPPFLPLLSTWHCNSLPAQVTKKRKTLLWIVLKIFRLLRCSSLPLLLRRTLPPPPLPLRRRLSPVPRFFSFPPLRATSTTPIGFFLSHSSLQGSSRGHDPPLIAAATRASSTTVYHHASLPPSPRCLDPDRVDGPSSVFGGMVLVTLPPPMGFTPQDLLSARVSRLPPRLSIFASFTSQVPYPRQFLRLFMMVTIIPHLLGGFVMLLHLLSTIIMHLHLWRLRLHSLLRRCVLCLKRISLLLWHWTLPCLSWLQTTLL